MASSSNALVVFFSFVIKTRLHKEACCFSLCVTLGYNKMPKAAGFGRNFLYGVAGKELHVGRAF
jgi:hypothetical protein